MHISLLFKQIIRCGSINKSLQSFVIVMLPLKRIAVTMFKSPPFVSGLWNDNVCSKSLGFICSKPPGGTTPAPGLTPTPMPGNCPVGSSAYGDKCFVLIYGDSDKKSWQDAESACSDMGVRYHLASISSQQEQGEQTTNYYNVCKT